MLLFVFIFFVKIEFFSCIFDNKNQLDEINRERTNLGLNNLQIHLTLQLAARKRCTNQEELMQTYEKIIRKSYRNDDWPKEEQLNKIFPLVSETIYFNGLNNIFDNSLLIPNLYRTNFLYIGIAENDYKNFSTRCILYGSSNNFISNHRRLLRLLYILIGCGVFLLSLIICSIINDRRQAKLKQELQEEVVDNRQTMIVQKSMTDQRSIPPLPRRTEMNRITMGQLGSTINERSSAVHSFFQSPK